MQDGVLLDPTGEASPVVRGRLLPPTEIDGLTVALLDIGKARGDVFLDRVQSGLESHGLKVERYAKPTNTKVAPTALNQEIAERCDLVVEALSD
ncbi:MAG: hypothetical protein CMQ61_00105 [Gammaproteobacteria bacterium]|nr:hypothetical protein [Gammaproteobacteria bacterium]|tara:strand:+ start:1140 stop:1421 length:282 start_codon:yes stop_codon:yes gene_type:complete